MVVSARFPLSLSKLSFLGVTVTSCVDPFYIQFNFQVLVLQFSFLFHQIKKIIVSISEIMIHKKEYNYLAKM